MKTILDTVGNTPLIAMPKLTAGLPATILFKLEFFNPLNSVKDRMALSIVTQAEKKGLLKPGMRMIEPTSGSTGIALAFIAASRGYPLTLVMPETMSMERRVLLLLLGAELIITPEEFGMHGAVAKAQDLLRQTPGAFMPSQFENPDNPLIHYQTTGPEIWKDTHGEVDAVVCGIGTGGTFTGIGRFLKEKKPSVKMVAVEPAEAPVISGGLPGPHQIQGIGAGFVPRNLDRSILDSIELVSSEEAVVMAKRVLKEEGVPVGISSGAAIQAALNYARKPEAKGKTIVAIVTSQTERYLSSVLGQEAQQKVRGLSVTE